MHNFLDIRLPEDISLGAEGGPEFSTDIITSASGHEFRNINWLQARARYNLAPAITSEEQLSEIITFFRLCRGRALGFRFKDFSDYKVTKQVIGTGDGINKSFQIAKKYQSSDFEFLRPISKPVIGTARAWIDTKEVAFNCDYSTGVVSFEVPVEVDAEVIVDCEFDIAVRFDTDNLLASVDALKNNAWQDIPLIEIRG